MKPIYDAWLIQIEIANACNIGCANCTRLVGHHRKPYFMDLDFIEKAIDSLEGFKGGIGIMGGEPTLHPQFEEICKLIQRKGLTHKAGLWTSGYKWNEYKKIIKETFKLGIWFNDHSDPRQRHQPILVAISEVIKDKKLMWKLIDNCWVQETWSPSINPKGGFFCEVAAALDLTFNGPGGYPIEPGWWNKTPEEFRDQVERYCPMCGAALPFTCPSNKEAYDYVSPKNYQRLLKIKSPKALCGRVKIFDRKMSKKEILMVMKNWKPYEYLGGGKRKKDLTLEDVLIIKQIPPLRILEAIIRNPIEAISTSVKYPKDVLNYTVYGIKKKMKRLISFGEKC
jgi:hypothetical protein